MAPPIKTLDECDSVILATVKSQIGAIGRLLMYQKTTRETSPQKMASTKCSKYSIPNQEQTSKANSEPPIGTPKNPAKATAMPIRVCFRTTLFARC